MGQITSRDGNINTRLMWLSGTSVERAWSFSLDGTYQILDTSDYSNNASGTYILKNGLLTLTGKFTLSGNKDYRRFYIDSSFRIHVVAFVKDISIFERGQTPSQPGGDIPTTPVDDNPSTHEHNYTAHVVPPTCTEEGYTEYVCSCGDSYKSDYTDALGHNYNSVVTEPTCTEQGYTTHTCSRCNNSYVDSYTNELGHDYVSVVTEPTCTEQGYTTKTCSRCGDSYKTDTTSALGYHSYAKIGEPYIYTSCALSSTQKYKCSVCGDEIVRFVDLSKGVSDCHNHLEVGDICEHCGYKVYLKNSDGMVLMDIGDAHLSVEFYGKTANSINNSLKPYVTNVFFSSAVKEIRDTCSNCDNLEYVTIPQSVVSISSSAFVSCDNLRIVDMPQHLYSYIKSFEDTPWYDNLAVETVDGIEYRGNVAMGVANNGGFPPTSVKLKDGTVGIAYSAFDDCDYLLNITIPDSVASIGSYAFYNCTGLTSITIPDSVTSIGDRAFYGCSGLTSVTIGKGVTSIGESAFYGCTSLTSVTIPDSVTSIGDRAFYGCTNLQYNEYDNARYLGNETNPYVVLVMSIDHSNITSCEINSNCKIIYDNSMTECYHIASITIPSGIRTIGYKAFDHCLDLTSIILPNSITAIGSYAFYCCDDLTVITFEGTKEQWNAISKGEDWDYVTGNYTIHCKDGDINKE